MPSPAANELRPGDIDLARVDAIIAQFDGDPADALPMLHAVQREFHYLPDAALRRVCERTRITPAALAGVASFYAQFRRQPAGRHTVKVCTGTACHVKGSGLIWDALRRHLRLAPDADTDAVGLFTLQQVACLGCCTLAPVVQIDQVTYGHATPSGVADLLRDFLDRKTAGDLAAPAAAVAARPGQAEVRVGLGSCCIAGGSARVQQAFTEALHATGVAVTVKRVGCVGMCHQTPLAEIRLPGLAPILYARLQADDVPAIVHRHFPPARPAARLKARATEWLDQLFDRSASTHAVTPALGTDAPAVTAFLGRQRHLATEHCGALDPLDLDEYRRHEGFAALRTALSLSPESIIAQIQQSGLRGRGGAGFPTGAKWACVQAATGTPKYLICNGDEGDPGAFMDRMLLESYPYRIIEGMLIAAHAVGAQEGILYIRAEYPLALQRIREALRRCAAERILGERVLDSHFRFSLRVIEGGGAFVCGEETALIASLEGRRGTPRFRPPYPAQHGLHGAPTLINNCETLALVPWILRHGPAKFAALGTPRSKGTKVFALAGKIARGGLIEVPMGISLRDIVYGIGGGIAGGREFKAVQVGGPSGGCLPASLADLPVDFEDLAAAGAMMGSGGLVVLDDTDCMVDITRYFLSFTQSQSCGKCTFCRVGTKRLLEILDGFCAGTAKPADLRTLEELAHQVKQGSLCGLGRTAPNPILTTLRYFRDEYEAHLAGRCPAKKCKALIRYVITDKCIGCTKCAQQCPADAIPFRPYEQHVIDDAKCIRCGSCKSVCPAEAVEIVTPAATASGTPAVNPRAQSPERA